MTTKYSVPSIESILEDSEDDSSGALAGKHDYHPNETSYRERYSSSAAMVHVKANTGRERDRPRRKHRSSGGRRHHSRKDEIEMDERYASGLSIEDSPQVRHRRASSNRNTSSSSSDEEEPAPMQDHRAMLQARAKLTSPSVISNLTSLTTTTNQSSGSSGSNSTVTQASVTKRSLEKRPETPETPVSPAVPDPPDVFQFQVNDSEASFAHHGDEDDDETQWPSQDHEYNASSLPPIISADQANSSSSTSSSSHGSDQLSEHSTESAGNDTDRSTSPERSGEGHSDQSDHEEEASDPAAAKIASQIAAAQQRQNQYAAGAPRNFRISNVARGPQAYPNRSGSSVTAQRYPQPTQQRRILPPPEKAPTAGYGSLALRLSHANANPESDEKIKPMYRKFESLNHRLLLHLQDELCELEDRLHRLDHADTQSRQIANGGTVVPASRRAARAAGGEIEWHKMDLLGQIGYKLAQYNQALSSFHAVQALDPPDPTDIDQYREYLQTEHPIVEAETHFLDPTDDLVSVCSERTPRYAESFSPGTQTSDSSSLTLDNKDGVENTRQGFGFRKEDELPSLAAAIAAAVLFPILIFSVTPGFISRMAIVGLVAGFVVFFLAQSGATILHTHREGLICAGVYTVVMSIIAGIM